jgi:hypothetical protein
MTSLLALVLPGVPRGRRVLLLLLRYLCVLLVVLK